MTLPYEQVFPKSICAQKTPPGTGRGTLLSN